MGWVIRKSKLGPPQTRILDEIQKNPTRPHWIRGFAGSGKSVVLIQALVDCLTKEPRATATVITFTHALIDMLQAGVPEKLRGRANFVTFQKYKTNPRNYSGSYIFVDEVQDLTREVLELIKANAKVLIMAGDQTQSIYPGRVDSDTVAEITDCTDHHLKIVYRLSGKLKDVVAEILPKSGIQSASIHKLAANVKLSLISGFPTSRDEYLAVWSRAQRYAEAGEPIAIIFKNKRDIGEFFEAVFAKEVLQWKGIGKTKIGGFEVEDFEPINRALEGKKVPLRYLGNSFGSYERSDVERLVFVMTMHSAKGLDFETVFLPGLSADLKMLRPTLMFVAVTRSRRNLFISHTGTEAHDLVQRVEKHLHKMEIEDFEGGVSESEGPGTAW